jgi:energy-coupling factor transporter ATP-binding protein EcfA2
MDLLNVVDTVILLLTPAYKEKVNKRSGGVYKEYSKIVARYFQLREQKKTGDQPPEMIQPLSFAIRPVLFSGDIDASVPKEIMRLKHLNLIGFRALQGRDGTPYIPTHGNINYLREIEALSQQIRAGTSARTAQYRELRTKYFKDLFIDLKADWRNPIHNQRGWVEQMFVKTSVSQKVERQEVIAVVGRKGSGKSTLVDVLAIREKDRLRGVVDIRADDFTLEYAYDKFTDEQRPLRSDTDYALRRFDCLAFAWKAYLYISVILAVVRSDFASETVHTSDEDKELLTSFADRFRAPHEFAMQSSDAASSSALLVYCHDTLEAFINELISRARPEEHFFFHDITRQFTEAGYLHYAIGNSVLAAVERLFDDDDRHVLFTLDGFDRAFDMFRRDRIGRMADVELDQRAKFELDWLQTLLITVLDMRSGRSPRANLDRALEFCFMIPEDRFLEIERRDRDSYRYQGRYHSLSWSGIELALLLRKRLQGLKLMSRRKFPTVRESLEYVLRTEYDHIPSDVAVPHNGRAYRMPLFMYVLRHTFWRPRDVLVYYAGILGMAEDLKRRGYEVSFEDIRKSVSQTTIPVVRSEFINEFASTLLNIREIISAFIEKDQILSYAQVHETIGPLEFNWASTTASSPSLAEKIRFLYQVGFLGINASKEDRDRLRFATFYFNEGLTVFRGDRVPNLARYEFVIHPIFCEFLELDTTGNPLALVLDWKYLEQSEAFIFAGGSNWMR